jgi:hypothetical protein
MRILFLGTVLCTALSLGLANNQTTVAKLPLADKKATFGELDGFVFAITKAGDLKPARLGHIVLLYTQRTDSSPNNQPDTSPGLVHLGLVTRALLKITHRASEGKFICQDDLQDYLEALKSTVDWAVTNKKSDQVKASDADEEGRFRLRNLVPGEYTLTAVGQAGANTAYWEEGHVVIREGEVTSVKLSPPKKACPIE